MTPLDDAEIGARLQGSDWHRDGDSIVRDVVAANFVAAMTFANAVAELAEAANHHPDILIHGYKNVRLTLSTHSAGGLTENDFTLAGEIDSLAAQ